MGDRRLWALTMASLLLFGILMGLRHALDADHVAAVATLASRTPSSRAAIRQGISWGLGHAAVLIGVVATAGLLGGAIPPHIAAYMELLVGIMLIGLGGNVLWRLLVEHVHMHAHRHGDNAVHLHFHSRPGHPYWRGMDAQHVHSHAEIPGKRALLVGMMHGIAGSATLLLVTAQQIESVLIGVLYASLFGFGSLLGMALLSVVIALPLRAAAKRTFWSVKALRGTVGAATIAIGVSKLVDIAARFAVQDLG